MIRRRKHRHLPWHKRRRPAKVEPRVPGVFGEVVFGSGTVHFAPNLSPDWHMKTPGFWSRTTFGSIPIAEAHQDAVRELVHRDATSLNRALYGTRS